MAIGFTLELDGLPPSLNTIRRPVNGRLVSVGFYRKWLSETIQLICWKVDPAEAIGGKKIWNINIHLYGLNRRSDLDNRVKATIDALVKAGVVPDDRWCDGIFVHRKSAKGEQKTVILVREA